MTSPESCQNADAAALYALDALDADECEQFEHDLLDSVELDQAVCEFEEVAATLAYSAPLVPMAADLKDRLFQRIAADSMGPSSDLVRLLDWSTDRLKQRAAELDWLVMPGNSGAEVAVWQVNERAREVAFFVRKYDSGLFPNHKHASGETVLVLDGDFVVGNQVYGVGEWISSPGGTSHQPETRHGCLLFCVSSMDDDIVEN